MIRKLLIAIICLFVIAYNSTETKAQQTSVTGSNYISTAVPFLSISPDARAGALGDTGVATSADNNSMFWNPAKYAFIKSNIGISGTYTPWLRNIVDDMSLSYLGAHYRLDKYQVISTSFRYFSLGEIFFQENENDFAIKKTPYELAFDVAYSRRLGENLSGSIAFRYIFSDINQGSYDNISRSANSFAADISFYNRKEYGSSIHPSVFSWGVNISNIGAKISYSDNDEKEFIPTNLRLGSAYKHQIDQYNSITISADMNKLLVPSSTGRNLKDDAENKNTHPSDDVLTSIFTSFTDASGGMGEELKEITLGIGLEYLYLNQFAFRTGYFYEHQDKGNRKFYTAGLGVKFKMFNFDFSYLIPTTSNNPLQNTLRVSVSAKID